MMFVPMERLMPALFVFAIMARLLIAVVASHLLSVAAVWLVGADPDSVDGITALVLVLVVIAGLIGIWVGSKQPDGRTRMQAGPRTVSQWRTIVLVVGIVSNAAGLFLFVSGFERAGMWAMGLGTAIVVLEASAIGGAIWMEIAKSRE